MRLLIAFFGLILLSSCTSTKIPPDWKQGTAQGLSLSYPPSAMIFRANPEGEIIFQINIESTNTLLAKYKEGITLQEASNTYSEGLSGLTNFRNLTNSPGKFGGKKGQRIQLMADYANSDSPSAKDYSIFAFLFEEKGQIFEFRFTGKGDVFTKHFSEAEQILSSLKSL